MRWTFAMAVPKSEPARRPVTVTRPCRFSRRISFCGGRLVTVASEPRVASLPVCELKTVFSIASSEARVSGPKRTRTV